MIQPGLGFWDSIANASMKFGGNVREEISLALDTTTGGALSPQSLEKKIVELVNKISPLIRGLSVVQSIGKSHEFNQRTALGTAYMEGEKSSTPSSQSTYVRVPVPLKIARTKGGVTGFQQAASKAYIDSYVSEIVGQTKVITWLIETMLMYGNATADQYQFNGIDPQLSANRFEAGAVITLKMMDDMADSILQHSIDEKESLAFYLSPQLHSKVSTLATEVRKQITKVQYPGGVEMDAYRDIPLVDSSFARPTSRMGVVAGAAAVGGAMTPASTYRYKIAPIILGEQWASAETSVVLGGGDGSVNLTWAAVPGALSYKIYRTVSGGAANAETLLTTIAGWTYDGDGTPIAQVVAWKDTLADAALTSADTPLDYTNREEVIFLLNRNKDLSMDIPSLVNERGEKVENMIQMLPLARTKDVEEFQLQSYLALAYKADILNSLYRRVRIA